MKNSLVSLLLFFLICIFCKCKDTFIADISSKKVVLTAPADSLILNDSIPTFFWNELEEADNYRIQIVSPGFDTIERVFTDSTVSSNLFTKSLNRGRRYQWRVKAVNGGSQTAYSDINTLIIR
jgi:hypothetical protein